MEDMLNAPTCAALRAAVAAGFLVLVASAASTGPAGAPATLSASEFADPSDRYGVNCWWWWLNGNTDRKAISGELAAMKAKHFQGALVFDAGGWKHLGHRDTVPPGPKFGSDAWCGLFRHALDEAEKNGLELGLNIMSGWNLGGPGVTPEMAAKRLTFSATELSGGEKGARLAQPPSRLGFYRDIAVLAMPIDERSVSSEPVQFLMTKIACSDRRHSIDCRFLLDNRERDSEKSHPVPYVVPLRSIRNVTASMRPDGTLDWTCPPGRWKILRIGFTCTGSKVSTCSATWGGHTLDYLSAAALDAYLADVVDPLLRKVSRHVGNTLKYIQTDSWECGAMNWTDGFGKSFADAFGYDPVPWLAAIGGVVVDDMDATHAFLADFRKMVGKAICGHYARLAQYAHGHGMGTMPESSGPHPAHYDGIANYAHSDIAMSEFWLPDPPRVEPRWYVKQAAAAAHVYGKAIVGAESFTSIGPQWDDCLWRSQKRGFDHEVCAGLNRVYLHTFTSSPKSMGVPGQEYFAGTHINPRVTWWGESDAFFGYLRRVQYVVQRGRFCADVLYYGGDHVPNVYHMKASDLGHALPGFDYDVADEGALVSLRVDGGGRISAPRSPSYRVLALPDHGVLSPAALKAVERLLRAGATVVGGKPRKCVTLKGGEAAQKEFRRTSDALWGDGTRGVRAVGKGKLVSGMTSREYLLSTGLPPDFAASGATADALDCVHYAFDGADAYFVANQTNGKLRVSCAFRIAERSPELWDPLTGEVRPLPEFAYEGGVTSVPLEFEPYGAYFVVFRGGRAAAGAEAGRRNFPQCKTVLTLDGPWEVAFNPAWGGPARTEFTTLCDWTKSSDPGIRYYSGAAVYTKKFTVAKAPAARCRIELGNVLDVGIATVRLNGRSLGTAWTAPFAVDATGAFRAGENTLEVKVVNSWHNRVLGDQLQPAGKTFTNTNIEIALRNRHKGRLSPSGLLGPVVVKEELGSVPSD
ncbi:MAG: glycoside hydrolase [Kiritimatiellae bacterium]|nr:glycoside hydrolase [Kiritimatiellia bacterium]